MPNRTSNIRILRHRVKEGFKIKSSQLLGADFTESGLLDHSVLNQQIEEILDGLAEKPSLAPRAEQLLEGFLGVLREGDVQRAAEHVCSLLSLELDDLRSEE